MAEHIQEAAFPKAQRSKLSGEATCSVCSAKADQASGRRCNTCGQRRPNSQFAKSERVGKRSGESQHRCCQSCRAKQRQQYRPAAEAADQAIKIGQPGCKLSGQRERRSQSHEALEPAMACSLRESHSRGRSKPLSEESLDLALDLTHPDRCTIDL